MRECMDCAHPLNDGAVECDWCAMRDEIRRLNDEIQKLRRTIWDVPSVLDRRRLAVRPTTEED